MTKLIALSALLLGLAFTVQALKEDDYPEIEIPGVAIPDPDQPDYESVAKPDDTPCCMPSSWAGNVTVQGGSRGGRGGSRCHQPYYQIFVRNAPTKNGVGSTAGQQSMAGKGVGGRFCNETSGFIMNFDPSTNTSQLLVYVGPSMCFRKNFTKSTMHSGCYLKNATHVDGFTIGTSYKVDLYTFGRKSHSQADKRGGRGFASGSIFVDSATCFPVAVQSRVWSRRGPRDDLDTNQIQFDDEYDDEDIESDATKRRGKKGGGSSSSILFTDMSTTVDETAFVPPSYCSKAIHVSKNEMIPDMPDAIEYFATF